MADGTHTVIVTKDGHRIEVFPRGLQSVKVEWTAAGSRVSLQFWLDDKEAIELGRGLLEAVPPMKVEG